MNRLESKFTDFKPALNATEAVTEANRCINCYEAPCITACPTGIDIPQFIGRIANDNTRGAAKTILDSNIFGLSCAQACPTEVLCEGACVYNGLNKKPIQIGRLQRFAVEYAYDNNVKFYSAGKSNGKKVALIGAGPASLSCAHELRKFGYEATVYEKTDFVGGLNTSGIAPYKMKAEVSLREVERVKEMGVKIEHGKELGRNLDLNEITSKYDAVFLGMGLGPDSRIDADGMDHPLVAPILFGAVDFIARMKMMPAEKLSWVPKIKTALVVGGGNTALDACRELKGLGVEKVIVSYRRGEAEMSGYVHEFKYSRQEGVEFWFHTLPVKFTSKSDTSVTVTVQKTTVDGSGKVVLTNEKMDLDCGLVLMATGQAKLESVFKNTPELKFEKGKLVVDKNQKTGHAKIFAGGDLSNGAKEVVNAVAEGRDAARAIHAQLGGK